MGHEEGAPSSGIAVKEAETLEATLRPQTLFEPDKSQINDRAALQLLAAVLQAWL